ncbi:MAG: class II aldolase/adducin family protein [Methanomicrobiaceae archaeon]|uniref:Ribulose-5-phosphate 4-epimerase n=1 Tax=hydrocarbon metagenome TaxID=938273 RepID=A0A0W8FDS0_9ZZZZ|nr:class II aldolase/adducin family protein [Methanomicrobiaceae archaeon]
MSVRCRGGFAITRAGSYLDICTGPIFVPDAGEVPKEASSEYRVHRSVYAKTPHSALVHAHPAHAVAVSLHAKDAIVPLDSEGLMLFCPEIPIVDGPPGTDALAASVAEALTAAPVAIARGHGTFAAGKTLDEAFLLTSAVEHTCRILLLSGRFLRL